MRDFEMAEEWIKIAEGWYVNARTWIILNDLPQVIKCEIEGLLACHRARMAAGLRARTE